MDEKISRAAWLEGASYPNIELNGNCSIGRMQDNDLVLADDRVSRHHALVQQRLNQEFWLIDLGSSNGTFVNQRRVRFPTLLHDLDEILVGDFCLNFHQTQEAPLAKGLKSTIFEVRSIQAWLLVTDIVNSSQFQKVLPPEEARAITHAFMNQNRRLVEQHNGMVNQFLGDGVFAYWIDSEHSEHVVTDVAAAIQALVIQDYETPIQHRMALHFGKALVGGGVLGEENLHGPDVNFVFRMEQLAKQLGESSLISQPAATRLEGSVPTTSLGGYGLPDYDSDTWFFCL